MHNQPPSITALVPPKRWVQAGETDDALARVVLSYRRGSAPFAVLLDATVDRARPLDTDGGAVELYECGPLNPNPCTVRELVGAAYHHVVQHFLTDGIAGSGKPPKAADARITFYNAADKEVGTASKKLSRATASAEAYAMSDDASAVSEVRASSEVLGQTVSHLSSAVVNIAALGSRERTHSETLTTSGFRAVVDGFKELGSERKDMLQDCLIAQDTRARAEEERKRLDLEKQLADRKGFFETELGVGLGKQLALVIVPALGGLLGSLSEVATGALAKRQLRNAHELRELERELAEESSRKRAGEGSSS